MSNAGAFNPNKLPVVKPYYQSIDCAVPRSRIVVYIVRDATQANVQYVQASSQIGQYAAPASPANTNSRASSFANVQPIAVPYPNNHPPTPPISPTNQTSAAASRKIKYKSNGDPEKKRGRKPGTKNRSKEEIRAEREKPKNPVGRPRKDRNNGAQSTVAAGPPVVQLFLPIFDPRLLTPSNTAGQVTSPPTDYHQAGQQSNQSVGFGVTNPGTYQAGQAIDSQSDYPVGSKRNQSVDSGYNSPPSDRADHSFADQYINFEGNSPTNDPASRATDPVPHHHLANDTPKDVNMDGSSPANSAAVVAGFDWTKWDLAN